MKNSDDGREFLPLTDLKKVIAKKLAKLYGEVFEVRSDGFIGITDDEEKVMKFCEQIKKESAENVMKLMALKEIIFGKIGPEKKDSETKESASEVKKNSSFYAKAREMEENKEEIMKLKEYEKRLKTVVENSSEVAIIWE